MREYALEQLIRSGDDKGAGARQAEYFLALGEQAQSELSGDSQVR